MKRKTRLMALLLCALMLFQTTAFAETSSVVDAGAVTEELYQGWVETATAYAADFGSNYSLKQSNYRQDSYVYWDETDAYESASYSTSSTENTAETKLIKSVTFAGKNVAWGNSNEKAWSGGTQLVNYYGEGVTTSAEGSATLTITPKEGYYVSKVVIACTRDGGSEGTPYTCGTWKDADTAFTAEFEITAGGAASVEVNSKSFGHGSQDDVYFILIIVAPVPSPLYIEYEYGNIVDILDSAGVSYDTFSREDGADTQWTTVTPGNNIGEAGQIDTNYTQYRYAYNSGNESDAALWLHYANTVTNSAKAQAAAAGYYFTGWKAYYYTDMVQVDGVDDVNNTKDEWNNNWTYNYDEETAYGEGTYSEEEKVSLTTNVRLIAQWAPISLKVTKTVEGLASISEHSTAENTFEVTLFKTAAAEGDLFKTVELQFTITGDGSLAYTVAASGADQTAVITPGTYTIVEDAPADLEGETENAYCSVTYPKRTVTVAADGTVQELSVLNTYSSTPATVSVTIEKQVTGNMGDRSKEFSFVVKDADGKALGTLSLAHGATAQIEGVTIGTNITITETTDGYSASYAPHDSSANAAEVSDADGVAVYTIRGSGAHIVCTNEKNETVDTGILLDSLPYVLILMLVGGGAVLWGFNRRRRRED